MKAFRDLYGKVRPAKKHISVVRLQGVIQSGPGQGGFSSGQGPVNVERYGPALERAFKSPGVEAVALVMNSPGGSPVQSSLLHKRIQALKKTHDKPVYAFVEDVCASGGYYIACAADEIVVDESSIVGSIGVVRASFGLKDAIAKLGIERRVQTAGAVKSQLDPFKPQDLADLARSKDILEGMHETFINVVKSGREGKLNPDVAVAWAARVAKEAGEEAWKPYEGAGLFDGSYHLGPRGVEFGLADCVSDMHSFLRQHHGDLPLKPYKAGRQFPFFGGAGGAALGVESTAGSSVADSVVDSVVQRLKVEEAWARFDVKC